MAFSFGQPASGGGGAPTPTTTPSFSFGGAPVQQQQKPGGLGFSFGGGAGAGSTQPQASGSSLFGNTGAQQLQQQQPSSSLFGGNATQQQQGQGSSLCGQQGGATSSLFAQSQPQQQQQHQPGGPSSLFGKSLGAQSSSTPFGQQQQQQQQPQPPANQPLTLAHLAPLAPYSQAGQQANRVGQSGMFGAGGAGQGPSSSVNATGAQDKRLGILVNDKLEAIRAAWDMQNIQACQFMYYFYNSIPPNPPGLGEAALANPNFGRRQDAVGPRHDGLWLQTLRENPDRSKLVPVLAIGFPDLKTRIEAQQAETNRQSNKLAELQKRLDDLTSKHSLSNSVRISAISRKQTSLHHRLVGLAKRMHLLIPALRGHSITGKEEQLKSLLHSCEMEFESISMAADGALSSSGSAGSRQGAASNSVVHHRLRGRINELWALLGTVKAKREASAMGGDRNRLEWAVVDEAAIEDVVKILAAQQQGLDHLSTTLQGDTRALDTIVKGLDGVELIGTR